MRIEIHGNSLSIRPPLREYVRRALSYALGRCSSRIQKVRVNLSDLNGPRGGADKRCGILVDMGRLGTVMAQDTDARLCVAIDQASERAGQGVRRAMERRLERRRRPLMEPLGDLLVCALPPGYGSGSSRERAGGT